MRTRVVVAAVAGVAGAVVTHALDEAALLPGVHESAEIREAMTPPLMVGWLVVAAAVAALAARTRPVPVGAVGALVVSGVPELVGRHDPGAVAEPGAMAGAVVQWLLLMVVLALLVAVDRTVPTVMRRMTILPFRPAQPPAYRPLLRHRASRQSQPRAPPSVLSPTSVTFTRGTSWQHSCAVAFSRPR